MGVGSNPTSDKNSFDSQKLFCQKFDHKYWTLLYMLNHSRVAQWKRAGPITQRSVDRNYALLRILFLFLFSICVVNCFHNLSLFHNHVPLAQRIARWTSNPKVLGSIPRWDDYILFHNQMKVIYVFAPIFL